MSENSTHLTDSFENSAQVIVAANLDVLTQVGDHVQTVMDQNDDWCLEFLDDPLLACINQYSEVVSDRHNADKRSIEVGMRAGFALLHCTDIDFDSVRMVFASRMFGSDIRVPTTEDGDSMYLVDHFYNSVALLRLDPSQYSPVPNELNIILDEYLIGVHEAVSVGLYLDMYPNVYQKVKDQIISTN